MENNINKGLKYKNVSKQTDRIDIIDNGIQNWSLLDEFNNLQTIQCEGNQTRLLDYLQNRKTITALNWQSCTTEIIDISKTNINELRIDIINVKEIILGEDNKNIFLYGTIPNNLKISHTNKGEGLSIYIDKLASENVPDFNLPRLSEIRIKPTRINAKTIVDAYQNLDTLVIWGNMGVVTNFQHLGNLSQLKEIQLSELFGFTATEFPTKKQWANLETLNISTYPKELTQHIIQEFSSIESFELKLPKTAAWVADNIDNPFRIWDNRHFSAKELKIAHTAYKKVSADIRKLKEPFDEKEIQTLLKDFVLSINKLRTKIETMERDEVSEIFDELLLKLKIDPSNAKYQGLFDDWREF